MIFEVKISQVEILVSFALLISFLIGQPQAAMHRGWLNATKVGTAQGEINSGVLLEGSEICLHLRRRSKNEMVLVGVLPFCSISFDAKDLACFCDWLMCSENGACSPSPFQSCGSNQKVWRVLELAGLLLRYLQTLCVWPMPRKRVKRPAKFQVKMMELGFGGVASLRS